MKERKSYTYHVTMDIPNENRTHDECGFSAFNSPFSDNLSLHLRARAAIQAHILA